MESNQITGDIIDSAAVQSRMLTIRNQQVLLDRDVAALYGVETKEINQAICVGDVAGGCPWGAPHASA